MPSELAWMALEAFLLAAPTVAVPFAVGLVSEPVHSACDAMPSAPKLCPLAPKLCPSAPKLCPLALKAPPDKRLFAPPASGRAAAAVGLSACDAASAADGFCLSASGAAS